MKIEEIEKLFEKQGHRSLKYIDKDGKDKEIKFGTCTFALRHSKKEYLAKYPLRLNRNENGEERALWIDFSKVIQYMTCARSDLKILEKHIFEKITEGGYPIFQTKAFSKENAT